MAADPGHRKKEKKKKKPKVLPLWKTHRAKKTFRIDGRKAWDTYWEDVWRSGKVKVKNPNKRTRNQYPKISIGYQMHQDPALRRRILEDYAKWRALNVEGLEISKYPNALHRGTHIHLEARQLNPEVSGLHKGDRYYGVIEDVHGDEFEVQFYDVRSGKLLRKVTVPRAKLGDYEARYHPWAERRQDIGIQASTVIARRWLLSSGSLSRP